MRLKLCMLKSSSTQSTKSKDLTGKDRFAWNVITSWGSYIFVLIPGFVMPRLISDFHGSEVLGIWDFCWAFVNYLRISCFWLGSSKRR